LIDSEVTYTVSSAFTIPYHTIPYRTVPYSEEKLRSIDSNIRPARATHWSFTSPFCPTWQCHLRARETAYFRQSRSF